MQGELAATARKPIGLAFELPDLLLARAVAEAHDLRLAVETDHHTERHEIEEMLAFSSVTGNACRWLIWREENEVAVRSNLGHVSRFLSLADALEWLAPRPFEPPSDITPGPWFLADS